MADKCRRNLEFKVDQWHAIIWFCQMNQARWCKLHHATASHCLNHVETISVVNNCLPKAMFDNASGPLVFYLCGNLFRRNICNPIFFASCVYRSNDKSPRFRLNDSPNLSALRLNPEQSGFEFLGCRFRVHSNLGSPRLERIGFLSLDHFF